MPKKLIEVSLPLEAINREAAREKSIRHGHPSTLHLWWARRPLAACRAVLFSSLVDDPDESDAAPEYLKLLDKLPGKGSRRERLFQFLEKLVKWENSNDEKILKTARQLIRACVGDDLPPILDPFCGGGSIPLEAQRLGLTAYASDLNPVAVLITKALIEIPPRFAGRPPVHPWSAGFQPASDTERQAGSLRSSDGQRSSPVGWHSRGYLPHFDGGEIAQTVTFRLADALPAERLEEWRREVAGLPPGEAAEAQRERVQDYLDSGHGSSLLRDPRAAALVEEALQHFDGQRYRLHAWVVMPNHVHVLFTPLSGHDLSGIVHSWKSFTANRLNRLFDSSGPVWQREYFDRYIRNAEHFSREAAYIEDNPVKAGLCARPDAWPHGSAGFQRSAGFQPASEGDSATLQPASELEEQAGGSASFQLASQEQAGSLRSNPRSLGQPRLLSSTWKGAQGLAEDVRYWGQWMRERAEERIGHLYPQGPNGETVIAWLWARTVRCPNPACGAEMPLLSSLVLCDKKGKRRYIHPVIEGRRIRFEVSGKAPTCVPDAKKGYKRGMSGIFECAFCGTVTTRDYVAEQATHVGLGQVPTAAVVDGGNGREYLSADAVPMPDDIPVADITGLEAELSANPRDVWCRNFGLTRPVDLFTPRQLVALTTFSDLVGEAREEVRQAALAAGLAADGIPLEEGGSGAQAYADAVATYLAFLVDKQADLGNSLNRWEPVAQCPRQLFARQAIPMVWDYAEGNPLGRSSGSWKVLLDNLMRALKSPLFEFERTSPGQAEQLDATVAMLRPSGVVISTDPPYYDNIGYADLSDFFYVWLRRSLSGAFPSVFSTVLVPKAAELVATSHRFDGGKEEAQDFFEAGLRRAFENMRRANLRDHVLTVYYAFKQAERDDEGSVAVSTGWETMLAGLLRAGFSVTGTWPLRTEMGSRMVGQNTNALASSIALVCRPRPEDAPLATRREFVTALRNEMPPALHMLQEGNIAPVDLAQASIGPGMAVFSRYAKVLEADGSPLTVRTALQIINQELDAYLAQQEGELDADTRFCLDWFSQYGMNEADFGQADVLARAKNTAVEGLVRAGVLESRRGKVRLLRRQELDPAWDPVADQRLTAWECTHHLIQALEAGGENAAARLVARLGSGMAETARALAYRLYSVCDRKGWADLARDYNNLVVSWPAIQEQATQLGMGEQTKLFEA